MYELSCLKTIQLQVDPTSIICLLIHTLHENNQSPSSTRDNKKKIAFNAYKISKRIIYMFFIY